MDINENYMDIARDISDMLERGDEDGIRACLSELTEAKNSELFREIGKLTRELHDVLAGFDIDPRISALAMNEIPDARERLSYVIEVTEQSAHRTLKSVEEALPVCLMNIEETEAMSDEWSRFVSREMNASEFRALSKKISRFFESSSRYNNTLKEHLNNILMAQDYQDITGQILKKVIDLVRDVEENLVKIIKIAGLEEEGRNEREDSGLSGPQIKGKESSTAVKDQDEVDDLLSSLGF